MLQRIIFFKVFWLLCFIANSIVANAYQKESCISIDGSSGAKLNEAEFFNQALQVISQNNNNQIIPKQFPSICNQTISNNIKINSAGKFIFFSSVDIESNTSISNLQGKSLLSFKEQVMQNEGGLPTGVIELLINTFKVSNLNIEEQIEIALFKLARKIVSRVNQGLSDERLSISNEVQDVYNYDLIVKSNYYANDQLKAIEMLIDNKEYEKALKMIEIQLRQGDEQEDYILLGIKISQELNQPFIASKLFEKIVLIKPSDEMISMYLNHAQKNGLFKNAYQFILMNDFVFANVSADNLLIIMDIYNFYDKNKAVELFENNYMNNSDKEVLVQMMMKLKQNGIWNKLKHHQIYENKLRSSADW